VRRRPFGRTGFTVSEIALGTVEIGLDYGIPGSDGFARPSAAEAERLLHFALDAGVNFIDTARAYGEAETIIGRAIGSRRSEFVLCSKVQPAAPAAVAASVEESLRQLRTDALDILLVHSSSIQPDTGFEIVPVMRDLQAQGKVRSIGASVYGEAAALAAINSGLFDCIQVAYSVLDRRIEAGAIAAARRHNVGIMARSVLLKGALTHRVDLLPAALDPLKQAVAERRAIAAGEVGSLPELAYRYVLSGDLPETALVGTSRIEELHQAILFARKGPLPEAVLERIRALPIPAPELLNPGLWPQ